MKEESLAVRLVMIALLGVLGLSILGFVGLAIFRREYARRIAALGETVDVDLAFGSTWSTAYKTAGFALRHPSTLRWGLIYALHLVIGIDPLAALADADLRRIHEKG
jgi:hypothetical protein